MGAPLPQLPRGLLLLGAAALAVPALETADLAALCGRTWQGDALRLRSHSASRKFYFVAPDTDCGLWMRAAAPGDRIRVQFHFFLVYSLASGRAGSNASAAPADPCAPGSYLQLYEGPRGAPRPLGAPLCGLTIPAPVASSGPALGLRLVTRGRQPRVDFVAEVTSFHLGPCGAYFRCQNGRCVPPSLVCDHWGMDNCGDGSDQGSWPPANCRGPWLQGMALASSLLLASAGLLWCCCSLGWLAGTPDTHGLRLRCGAPWNICHTCPGRVAPGGLRQSGLAFQDQEATPREAGGIPGGEWALEPDMS